MQQLDMIPDCSKIGRQNAHVGQSNRSSEQQHAPHVLQEEGPPAMPDVAASQQAALAAWQHAAQMSASLQDLSEISAASLTGPMRHLATCPASAVLSTMLSSASAAAVLLSCSPDHQSSGLSISCLLEIGFMRIVYSTSCFAERLPVSHLSTGAEEAAGRNWQPPPQPPPPPHFVMAGKLEDHHPAAPAAPFSAREMHVRRPASAFRECSHNFFCMLLRIALPRHSTRAARGESQTECFKYC